ncbi:MAG TPA: hypothetical protein VEV41_12635 [Terriglobales bacterium]|nr:hypothetical protein [Terriglobales bacterium]
MRNPEVHHFNVAFAVEHDVFGFEIAVNYSLRVRLLESGTYFVRNPNDRARSESTEAT